MGRLLSLQWPQFPTPKYLLAIFTLGCVVQLSLLLGSVLTIQRSSVGYDDSCTFTYAALTPDMPCAPDMPEGAVLTLLAPMQRWNLSTILPYVVLGPVAAILLAVAFSACCVCPKRPLTSVSVGLVLGNAVLLAIGVVIGALLWPTSAADMYLPQQSQLPANDLFNAPGVAGPFSVVAALPMDQAPPRNRRLSGMDTDDLRFKLPDTAGENIDGKDCRFLLLSKNQNGGCSAYSGSGEASSYPYMGCGTVDHLQLRGACADVVEGAKSKATTFAALSLVVGMLVLGGGVFLWKVACGKRASSSDTHPPLPAACTLRCTSKLLKLPFMCFRVQIIMMFQLLFTGGCILAAVGAGCMGCRPDCREYPYYVPKALCSFGSELTFGPLPEPSLALPIFLFVAAGLMASLACFSGCCFTTIRETKVRLVRHTFLALITWHLLAVAIFLVTVIAYNLHQPLRGVLEGKAVPTSNVRFSAMSPDIRGSSEGISGFQRFFDKAEVSGVAGQVTDCGVLAYSEQSGGQPSADCKLLMSNDEVTEGVCIGTEMARAREPCSEDVNSVVAKPFYGMGMMAFSLCFCFMMVFGCSFCCSTEPSSSEPPAHLKNNPKGLARWKRRRKKRNDNPKATFQYLFRGEEPEVEDDQDEGEDAGEADVELPTRSSLAVAVAAKEESAVQADDTALLHGGQPHKQEISLENPLNTSRGYPAFRLHPGARHGNA